MIQSTIQEPKQILSYQFLFQAEWVVGIKRPAY